MRRFRKNPEVRIVVIPPHGRVYDGDILEGEQYGLFCPSLLLEIVEPVSFAEVVPSVEEPAPVSAPVPAELPEEPVPVPVEVADVNSPPVEVTATMEAETVEAPVKRKRGRPKKIQTG